MQPVPQDPDADEPGLKENGRGTSVLLNAIHVLQAFSPQRPVVGVSEIARQVNLHKSTVSRILSTLEQEALVERDPASGRFRLGLGVIALAGPLLGDLDVRRVALPALENLVTRTQETAALMVWSGEEAVSVEQVSSPKHVKHTTPIGTRFPTAASSSVQVFLAHLPTAHARYWLERNVQQPGRLDQDTVDSYLHRLEEVRRNGYAVNDGETSIEEVGISSPVRDHRGEVTAAVLLSAPRFRVSRDLLVPYAELVRETADEVSARLGAPGGG